MFTVDYGTGAGNVEVNSLEMAKLEAVRGMSYTQQHVRILEGGKQVLISYWRTGEYNPSEEFAIAV